MAVVRVRDKMEELITKLSELRTMFMQLAIALRETNPEKSYANFDHSQICERAVNELTRNKPQEIEIEGGGYNWWYVCPECHGAIDRADHFCKHCGQAVKN